jgi:hypothetical protein
MSPSIIQRDDNEVPWYPSTSAFHSSRSEPQKIIMSPSIIQRDDNEVCNFQSSTPIHKSSKGIVRGSLVPSTSAFHSSRSEPQKIIMSPSIIQRDDNEICNLQSSTPIHKSAKGIVRGSVFSSLVPSTSTLHSSHGQTNTTEMRVSRYSIINLDRDLATAFGKGKNYDCSFLC